MTINTKIAVGMKARGITNSAMGKHVGVSGTTVHRWKHGGEVPASKIKKIATMCGYSVDYLVSEEQELPAEKVESAARLGKIIDEKDQLIESLKAQVASPTVEYQASPSASEQERLKLKELTDLILEQSPGRVEELLDATLKHIRDTLKK